MKLKNVLLVCIEAVIKSALQWYRVSFGGLLLAGFSPGREKTYRGSDSRGSGVAFRQISLLASLQQDCP